MFIRSLQGFKQIGILLLQSLVFELLIGVVGFPTHSQLCLLSQLHQMVHSPLVLATQPIYYFLQLLHLFR